MEIFGLIFFLGIALWIINSISKTTDKTPTRKKSKRFYNDTSQDPYIKELNKQTEIHLKQVRSKLETRTNFTKSEIDDYIKQYIHASYMAGLSRISLAESIRRNTNIDLSLIL